MVGVVVGIKYDTEHMCASHGMQAMQSWFALNGSQGIMRIIASSGTTSLFLITHMLIASIAVQMQFVKTEISAAYKLYIVHIGTHTQPW